MKIYLKTNVYQEALKRIEWVFDEFEHVTVGVSGGKDSTVVFNLALQVAKKKKRLPLNVMFIDQEAEWIYTIDMMKNIMYHPDVNPRWYQMPIQLFNATSYTDHWLWCWKEGEDWLREKEPIAITKNVYGTKRFAKLFTRISEVEYADTPHAYISGVRTEESPSRFIGLTSGVTYKWVTWGKIINKKKNHYTFYPIYDWLYSDVWKAINDNDWEYNKVYDLQYQYGVPVKEMRVSNLHHETAVKSLFHFQELDPKTYSDLTQRLKGIDMAGKLGYDDYFVKELPFMFKDWTEYRDYLLEKLITDEKWKAGLKKRFAEHDKLFSTDKTWLKRATKMHIQSILTNDWEMIKIDNFMRSPSAHLFKKGEKAWK